MFESLRREVGLAMIITRREIRDQFRDWRIIFPVAALTLFFPGLMNFTARQVVNFVERYGAPVIGERMIPFLLMIVGFFPISVSLVIALESFVGEKERRSIEPLLSSPLSDSQLYLGKLLAAMAPPLLGSYLGIVVYLAGVYRQVGWSPPPVLLLQILLLTTVQALVMVSGAVVVSAQTTSVRAANLLASFIIIPMALLIQGESVVMFWARYRVLWLVIAGLVLIAAMLVRSGITHFSREELLGRELDTLNIRWSIAVLWKAFRAGARSLPEWYRGLLASTRQMALPLVIIAFCLVAGVLVGASQASNFPLPSDLILWDNLDQGFIAGLEELRVFSPSGVGMIWLHNLRVILLALLLGVFSFSVLGLLVLMLPFMLIGYFMANLASMGLSPVVFLGAFILPHGILEIPAILFAGAAIIRLGATLLTPAQGTSIGEAVLRALADWLRVVLGLALPLFLGAAFLEVFLTPRVVIWLLGS